MGGTVTAGTGRLRIAPLGRGRRALVRRWLDRAAEEMYAAEGIDKGFTAEETRVARLTIDLITDQFEEVPKPAPKPAQGFGLLSECPNKTDENVWQCTKPNGTCIRCVPMTYKAKIDLP